MVLESFLSSKSLERKPFEMFIYSILMASFSLFVSYIIFPSAASIVFVFLITLSIAPLVYNVLKDDELIDEEDNQDMNFFETHEDVLKVYANFFLGVVVALSFWYTMLPDVLVNILFNTQISVFHSISNIGTSTAFATASSFSFSTILINNIKVATISFFMSFFFGTGAIFILSWNASVISVFIGTIAKGMVHKTSALYAYLYALPTGLLSIALHGIPEIAAYCIAGVAGGILSAGIIRNKNINVIIKDSLYLFALSIFVIFVSVIIEVYITPII
ncbi:MAG: stage II sporulation protein M [DPANN group archaeon]|nr:stage II sporulation protein M [DPANN group archaeon]